MKPHGDSEGGGRLDLEALREAMERQGPRPKFEPHAWYNSAGEMLEVFWSSDSSYAKRINDRLTLLLSIETEEVVGCYVKGLEGVLAERNLAIAIKHRESMEHDGHRGEPGGSS